jgi:hypothetical protein
VVACLSPPRRHGESGPLPRDPRQVKAPTPWTGILTGPASRFRVHALIRAGLWFCAHGPSGTGSVHLCSDDNVETWRLGGEVPEQLETECQVRRSERRTPSEHAQLPSQRLRAYSTVKTPATHGVGCDVARSAEPVCQGPHSVTRRLGDQWIAFYFPTRFREVACERQGPHESRRTAQRARSQGALSESFGYSCLAVLPTDASLLLRDGHELACFFDVSV